MIPAIASPSLNKATNASTSSADGRIRNDRSESMTAWRTPPAGLGSPGSSASAASVTRAPAAISPATPISGARQPNEADAATTPDMETSRATR